MRHSLFLLPLALLLGGCVNDTASYQIDDNREHALTVRVVQDYFWKKEGVVRLTTTHMPECQRQIDLGTLPLSGLDIELFASGPGQYVLRAGDETWQVETAGCSQLEAPDADAVVGQALGSFHMDEHGKLVFTAPDADAGAAEATP